MIRVLCAAIIAACFLSGESFAAELRADTIYLGNVVTMDAKAPRAAAVAVSGGRIVAVGSRAEVLRFRDRGTRVVTLPGRSALLPGFIDAHGHLTATAATMRFADLSSPPVGGVRNVGELQDALRQYIRLRQIPPGAWVIGRGYDDAQLSEHRHPGRDELDAVSREHPILVVHVSGHVAGANSAMLQQLGITADTKNPAGGVIRRREGGSEPDGVLEEAAFMGRMAQLPTPKLDDALRDLQSALRYYASKGITTVQEGAMAPDARTLLEEASRRNLLDVDVVAYRFWAPVGSAFPQDIPYETTIGRLRYGGIKLILDGSPQAKTAFLSKPYFKPPEGKPADYAGYPALPQRILDDAIAQAIARNVSVIAHANGDAAIQMLIDAVTAARATDATSVSKSRITMIHAQTARDDQLDRMAALGISPSFFIGHTFYWGDWHRDETLGPERGERISPLRSALDRGVAFSLHTDTPVVPPEMIQTLWSATTRRTRSDAVLGVQQRIGVVEALAAITIDAARQQGEADIKGSIVAGKQADFVILSADPIKTDPERLRSLRVLETISRGLTVYRAERL